MYCTVASPFRRSLSSVQTVYTTVNLRTRTRYLSYCTGITFVSFTSSSPLSFIPSISRRTVEKHQSDCDRSETRLCGQIVSCFGSNCAPPSSQTLHLKRYFDIDQILARTNAINNSRTRDPSGNTLLRQKCRSSSNAVLVR